MSKEPKLIDADIEAEMDDYAAGMIATLGESFPDARTIDLLNAFLREFIRLTIAGSSQP